MRALRQSQWFLALLCVLLIGARFSGAHWHLCFDRIEAPLTMHIGDIDLHDGGSATDGLHQDADLKLVDSGLIKSMSGGLNGSMLLAVFVCLWLLPLRARSVPYSRNSALSFPNDPRPLHAPPRAPPL